MEIRQTASGILFWVKVYPRRGRDRILRLEGNLLKLEVRPAAVRGKANRSLVKLISKSLGVPAPAVSIRTGEKCALKLIAVSGLNPEDFWRKLSEISLV